MPWEAVDDDEPLEEGDRVRTSTCVHTTDLPTSEVEARLLIETGQLTGTLNNQLPDCMEAEVLSRDLIKSPGVVIEGNECEYLYVVEYQITSLDRPCAEPATAGLLHTALLAALAILAVLLGLTLVIWRAEKFIEGGDDDGDRREQIVENVSTAALLAAGAWLWTSISPDDG